MEARDRDGLQAASGAAQGADLEGMPDSPKTAAPNPSIAGWDAGRGRPPHKSDWAGQVVQVPEVVAGWSTDHGPTALPTSWSSPTPSRPPARVAFPGR